MLIAGFVLRGSLLALRTHLVLIVLVLTHLLIDLAKMEFARKYPTLDGSTAYITDQIFHFLTVILAAWLLLPGLPFADLWALLSQARNLPNKFLAVPAAYVAIMFGGGYLIRVLTQPMADIVKNHPSDKSHEKLQNAGLYIGLLERFLIISALLLQSPAMIGLILTAKAIARYPEFTSERFAEYFLIGTLLSISLALAGGVLLSKLLFGQIQLSE